ncbi:hypothetical protein KC347_g308 [Hortaea werneckii]|nr:hypothetical protein KC347_g308 [Hortaea werneckii]
MPCLALLNNRTRHDSTKPAVAMRHWRHVRAPYDGRRGTGLPSLQESEEKPSSEEVSSVAVGQHTSVLQYYTNYGNKPLTQFAEQVADTSCGFAATVTEDEAITTFHQKLLTDGLCKSFGIAQLMKSQVRAQRADRSQDERPATFLGRS